MQELSLFGDKRMTVKEVADALGYEKDYLRKKVKELFPDTVRNGIETTLSEEQVTELKSILVPRTLDMKVQGQNVTTDLEMMEQAKNVMVWLSRKYEEEKLARVEAERKNAVLMHVSKTYTATEIAKELNMRSANELNKKLADLKVQYKQNDTWVLYAEYSYRGYTEIKQTVLDNGKVVYDRHFTQDGRAFILDLLGGVNE